MFLQTWSKRTCFVVQMTYSYFVNFIQTLNTLNFPSTTTQCGEVHVLETRNFDISSSCNIVCVTIISFYSSTQLNFLCPHQKWTFKIWWYNILSISFIEKLIDLHVSNLLFYLTCWFLHAWQSLRWNGLELLELKLPEFDDYSKW